MSADSSDDDRLTLDRLRVRIRELDRTLIALVDERRSLVLEAYPSWTPPRGPVWSGGPRRSPESSGPTKSSCAT